MNKSNAPKTTMRLPDDVVDWLKSKAKRNVSSLTAEVVRAIRAVAAQEHRERADNAEGRR